MSALTFSVVVNTLDRRASLGRALDGLRGLRGPDLEVVVVDGPSRDGTGAWLDAHAPDVVRASVPVANLAVSRNAGLRAAAGDIVAYLDDDAVPEPSWLLELARAFADPSVGAAGGFVRDPTGVAFQARHLAFDRHANAAMDVRGPLPPFAPGAHRFRGLLGANCAFRASALRAIGGFDEAYAYFLEEADVLMRLMDAGHALAVRPLAEVHHHYAPSALRDAARVPTAAALRTTLTSVAYYILQAAPAADEPRSRERAVQNRAEGFYEQVAVLRAEGRLSAAEHAALRAAIAEGLAAGRALAAASPARRVGVDLGPPSRPLARLIAPGVVAARRRFAVLLPREEGTQAPVLAVALALARRGHEVTTLVAGGEHRVERLDGIWRHMFPPRATGLALSPAWRPPGRAAAAWAAAVWAELARTEGTRAWQHVLATAGDPGAQAVAAAGRWPVARLPQDLGDPEQVADDLGAGSRS